MAASCGSNAMLPPPQESFENSKAAQEYLQVWARAHGYAVVLSRSAKAGQYLYFICDKGGEYRNTRKIQDEDRQRKTSTRKAGCTFRANISGSIDIWTITVTCPAHTGHDASNTTLAHPVHRRVDVASREQVLELVRHGSTARQIVPLLAQREPPLLVTSKDIANLIQSYRREVLQGRPPAEALLEWLEEQHWPHRTLLGAVSEKVQRLEGLFFAHPQGLKLLQRFGSVITVDATYNTNSHRMPLLHFVGLTSSNRSFTAALAYLPDETTLTYMWAFNALKELAPQFAPEVIVTDHDAALSAALLNTMPNAAQILCQWHVRQNVEKFARPRLPNQAEYEQFLSDFDELRDARTLDRLQDQSDALRHEWQDAHPALVDYIDEKLSAEHLWVAAYIDRHPHMGNRVTSRTEGAHATLKRYLHTRHGNLFTATQAMQNHFVTQHNHIASDLANDCQKVPLNILGDPFFVELSKNVSRHVLSILKTQDEVARRIAFQEKLHLVPRPPHLDQRQRRRPHLVPAVYPPRWEFRATTRFVFCTISVCPSLSSPSIHSGEPLRSVPSVFPACSTLSDLGRRVKRLPRPSMDG
ncbi:hypothetical protein A4X06_0g5717 [Tilletia controversa]|uniref:MULE transposase domain-containing protein n=1 Tax=Tilletia controversa TaxID=13291 RepID=A0A8X7MQ62_9BASI|nr:hypothetical protein A4X06_0g5717 [Tilletia controversa]